MKIYGFNAVVEREGALGYAGRIKELHVNTQGKTVQELSRNLKDVARLMIIDVLENEKRYSKTTISKAKATVIKAGHK
jgi:predicted RNase H-like HicB family nuclease